MGPIRFLLFVTFFLNLQLLIAQTNTASDIGKIKALTDSALFYFKKPDYQKSLLTSRVALSYAIAKKNTLLIAKCYNIIGSNYKVISQINNSIFFFEKGLSYANLTNDNNLKSIINNNLGAVYFFKKKNHKKGIHYFKKSLNYSLKSKDSSAIFLTKLNIAWAYFKINQFEKGEEHLIYLNKNKKRLISSLTIPSFYMINGMYAAFKNQNDVANTFFLEAINKGKLLNRKTDLASIYFEYSNFLNKIGNYKEAYKALTEYNAIHMELLNIESIDKSLMSGKDLAIEEYKRELEKSENEKSIQKLNLEKTKLISFLFVVISIFLLVLIFTMFQNILYKKKTNIKLLRNNEELLKANKNAEEASKLKTQFISTISHEVRTPLYGVVGITNILLEEHKELAKSQHLLSLKFSAKYLLSLVNDILQINKIEENKIVLEESTFILSDEIEFIKTSLSFLAQSNNNKVSIILDPKIPKYLIGDKLRLAQILMNLISNALKFTLDGEVFIIVNHSKIENEKHFLEFIIKDTGIGIASSDHEKVFDKFVQVKRKETDYQGTGLGLPIVKSLLKLFNSEISLKSNTGEGAAFSFTIAFDCDKERTNIVNEKEIKVGLTPNIPIKILVVEDNRINQMVTKKIIEKHNHQCKIVEDGYLAVSLLKEEKFDIILMDINMPILNGFETSKKIRENGIKTPIVALTAFDKEEIAEEAIASGMNDVIIKPFNPVKLFEIINYYIYNKSESLSRKSNSDLFEL